MPKKQLKKYSNNSGKMIKSVFFYGKPNKEKRAVLEEIQLHYTMAINQFIALLNNRVEYTLEILKNDNKSSLLRQLEKENRPAYLSSTYSQNAFDEAVFMLSNRLNCIKSEINQEIDSIFVSSKILFAGVLMQKSREELLQDCEKILLSYKESEKIRLAKAQLKKEYPDKKERETITEKELLVVAKTISQEEIEKSKKVQFYQEIVNTLLHIEATEFTTITNEILFLYACTEVSYKIPYVTKASVRTTSMCARLETSENITTSHVFFVTNPATRGKMISVPVNTSENTKRRIKQYPLSKSFYYTVKEDGTLVVIGSVEKKTAVIEGGEWEYRGVDLGIVDMLHTDDDHIYGSFLAIEDFYKKMVEPEEAKLTKLRNKKITLKKYLHNHKNIPTSVRTQIIKKMDNIEKLITQNKKVKKQYHKYYQMQEQTIVKTVNDYTSSLKGNKKIITVLELLDITVDKNKKNKKVNQKLSMFARGKLNEKLKDRLVWLKYPYMEVDPAFTSQVCPKCFHLDKENRNGKKFVCKACNFIADANHVGSINIKARAQDEELLTVCKIKKMKERHLAIREYYKEKHQNIKLNQGTSVS